MQGDTYEVRVEWNDGSPPGRGTAWAITSRHVVTCWHVLRIHPDVDTINKCVLLIDGKETEARCTSYSAASDLAVLEIVGDAVVLPVWAIAEKAPEVWSRYSVRGFPVSGRARMITGEVRERYVVESRERSTEYTTLSIDDGTAGRLEDEFDGMSGSPVIVDDQVVGVLRAVEENGVVGHAVSYRELAKFLGPIGLELPLQRLASLLEDIGSRRELSTLLKSLAASESFDHEPIGMESSLDAHLVLAHHLSRRHPPDVYAMLRNRFPKRRSTIWVHERSQLEGEHPKSALLVSPRQIYGRLEQVFDDESTRAKALIALQELCRVSADSAAEVASIFETRLDAMFGENAASWRKALRDAGLIAQDFSLADPLLANPISIDKLYRTYGLSKDDRIDSRFVLAHLAVVNAVVEHSDEATRYTYELDDETYRIVFENPLLFMVSGDRANPSRVAWWSIVSERRRAGDASFAKSVLWWTFATLVFPIAFVAVCRMVLGRSDVVISDSHESESLYAKSEIARHSLHAVLLLVCGLALYRQRLRKQRSRFLLYSALGCWVMSLLYLWSVIRSAVKLALGLSSDAMKPWEPWLGLGESTISITSSVSILLAANLLWHHQLSPRRRLGRWWAFVDHESILFFMVLCLVYVLVSSILVFSSDTIWCVAVGIVDVVLATVATFVFGRALCRFVEGPRLEVADRRFFNIVNVAFVCWALLQVFYIVPTLNPMFDGASVLWWKTVVVFWSRVEVMWWFVLMVVKVVCLLLILVTAERRLEHRGSGV